jgi:putative ABC transport system permease protein
VTTAAAEELNISQGDILRVRATRSSGGRREFGEAALRVVGILNPRASGIPRVYAPLSFVLDVESYKEGLAAPSRGWPGGTLRPYFSYDGILLVLPQPLNPVKESGLIINTGLTSIEKTDADKFSAKMGFPLKTNLCAYDLRPYQNAIQFSSLSAVKNKVRGVGAILLPYADNISLKLSEGPEMRTTGLSISALQAKVLGIPEIPWRKLEPNPPNQKLFQILPPAGNNSAEPIMISMQGVDGPLTFPVVNKGPSFGNLAVVPAELIGILRTARQRRVTYKKSRGEFLLSRTGFRGFRLYTRSIDDVVPLVQELKKEGIEIIAQTEAIERVRILDRGLTNIFRLVAVVGIAGGIAALIASLYAAVERKQQELSVMRLIGLSRLDVFLFPIYQGVTMALMSMLLAMGGYFLLSVVINRVFSSDLEMGERICELPPAYLVIGAATAVAVALVSSSFAAWRTTQIDPAEALRYE